MGNILVYILLIVPNLLVRLFSIRQPIPTIEFGDEQVVVSGGHLHRTLMQGALLRVPPNTTAIVTNPKGLPAHFDDGEHIVYFSTSYRDIQYVDLRRRNSPFKIDGASSRDGYRICIAGYFSWQVKDEGKAALIKEPIKEIRLVLEKAIQAITTDYKRDQLVPTPGTTPINTNELTHQIYALIRNVKIFETIGLYGIVITSREGDPNQLPTPPEPSEAENRANAERISLESRRHLIPIEKEISNHELEIEQRFAEVKQRIRDKEIELDIKREAGRLEIEREKIKVETRTAALIPFMHYIVQILRNPNITSRIDSWSINSLSRVMENIAGTQLRQEDPIEGEFATNPKKVRTAKEKLTLNLVDLWTIEDYTGNRLEELHNGSIGLVIYLNTKQAMFEFDVSGPEPVISKIFLKTSKGSTLRVSNPELYLAFTLPEVIKKLNDKFGSRIKKLGGTGSWI